MVFVLLYTPCVATVAAIRREAGAGWMWFSVASQLSLAWLAAFGVYQIGRLAGL
jgi:ferrous iron transport protein B